MRRLAFIVISLAGIVGGFQWISQNFSSSWEPRVRAYLEQTAGRATGTRVHIDSITLSFIHRIRLLNVRVMEPEDSGQPLFEAGEIELTVSLIDLPRALWQHKAYEAIGLVTVKNPWLRISQDALARRTSGQKSAAAALPPWFTLVWEGGTFQWVDPRAPGGAWTLYQAQGAFRIRGPQMNFAIRGSVQAAPMARFQFSSFGHRWNAQLYISDGKMDDALKLLQTLAKKSWIPDGWLVRGKFHWEARASGRRWPEPHQDWLRFLDEIRLTLIPDESATNAAGPSLSVLGTVLYKKEKITGNNISLETPWIKTKANLDVSLDQIKPRLQVTASARLASGLLGQWPFQDGFLQMRYANERWEFLQDSFRFLDGRVSAKGSVSAAGNDLQITAENISLAALGQNNGQKLPEGRLNASCVLKGPFDDWDANGSWWLAGMQWGQIPVGDAQGDFEITADHFQAQAASANQQFRFSTEGTRSPKDFTLDAFELYLPSGASLNAEGHYNRATHKLSGSFDALDVSFPADFPFLSMDHTPVKGILEAHGRIGGTWEKPSLKGNLQSDDLSVGQNHWGKTSISAVWDPDHLEIPAFHSDVGMDGHYTHDEGLFKIKNMMLGHWTFTRGMLHFKTKPDEIVIDQGSLQTPEADLEWQGKASWPPQEKAAYKKISFEGKGTIHSNPDPSLWTIPFDLTGHLGSENHPWEGALRLQTNHPMVRGKILEAFEGTMRWDSHALVWSDAHWGQNWTSHGTLDWSAEPATWSAHLQANRVPLALWQPLLWPTVKEQFHGLLSGHFDLEGTAQNPKAALSAHIENGRWRAFQFSADTEGAWSHQGLKPLTLKGHLKTGGDFEFSGLLTPEERAEGTLKLSGFNLHPLGESLGFPKPLEGQSTATLTLSGPLTRLVCNGHLEAAPLIYAAASEHPLKFEQVAMDMTLSPSEDDPSVMRLTLTEAQVKTAEELLRFQSGSFVEFAGQNPSRFSVGTQVRNLHLGIFTLFGGLDMDGTWQIKPEGFAIQGQAHTRSLFINDYELEEGVALADYYDSVLKFPAPKGARRLITGTIDFHNAPQLKFTDFFISGKEGEGLQLTGDIGPALWDFKMAGNGLDIGTLGELSGFPYPLSGSARVQVRGTGDPDHRHVDGNIDLDRGTILGLAFNSGSADFSWQNARITFTKLTLTDPGRYTLEGSGAFPLIPKKKIPGQDHSIDFSVRLKDSNLSLLQSLSQEVKEAKGDVDGLVQIKGTLDNPSLQGSLHVANGNILGAHYFRQLRDANLSLDFSGDTIFVRELRGKSGNGEFRGSGSITLAGFQPSRYDLKLDVVSPKGVDVQVPELAIPESPLAKRFRFLTSASRVDVRGSVALHGPADAPVFSGVGIFSNGHFTFPPSRKNPPSLAVMEWFQRITWDVDLKFQDGAWFENELVMANVAGHLMLKGPSDKLRVDGGLDISEGKISYLGLQFDIQQARFDMRSDESGGAVVNTPYMRGTAESQVQAMDTVSGVAGAAATGSRFSENDVITLTIDYAPIDQIKPRLTSASNPTLTQDKVLQRLTQTDIQDLTPQEQNYLYQKQALSLIDNSLATPLAQNVLKKAGIADRVSVQHVFDPNAITNQDTATGVTTQQAPNGTNLFANTKYTIEKDLSTRLSLGYGIRLVPSAASDTDIQQQQKLDLISDVQLSYRWFKNVYLKGDFDLPSSSPGVLPERKVTIEPRWRFGWWGNTNKDKEKPKAPDQ